MNEPTVLRSIGAERPRKDADAKVTGATVYTVDIDLPGMLVAKALRSPHAHARVVTIDASKARQVPGVAAVLTRDDLEGLNPTYGYFIKDQPIIALDKVSYIGDVVAAVAAEDEASAVRALERIEVEYESLPAIASIEEPLAPDAPALFEEPPMGIVPGYGAGASAEKDPRKNVCYRFQFTTGEDSAFDEADHIFEDSFHFSRCQHYHLEPFVTVARIDGDVMELWTSCQNPFPLRKELSRVFNHAEQNIRVHVPFIGAGFGAKNNGKTEPIAVLLAKMTRRAVRFRLTHQESFLTQSQHAAVLTLKTGVKADGKFTARKSTILLNAVAYSDASPLVAEKAGYRIHGPYRWRHIDSTCDCVMTNSTPAGPFRGFGVTQTTWARESLLDMIARRLGLDPYEMRMKNLLYLGEPYAPGESGIDSDLREGLDLVADKIGYHGRQRGPVPGAKPGRARGIGLSIGFKDQGGVNKPASAQVKTTTTGGIIVNCGSVEIGQGIQTALTCIVAEILGTDENRVSYAPINTDITPFDQGTNASSGICVMGQAIERAARDVRRQVIEFAAARLACAPNDLELDDWVIRRGNESHPLAPMIMGYDGGTGFEFIGHGFFKPETSDDAPLETPCVAWEIGWGGAEIEIDEETGQVTVLRLVVSGDAGRAIHPLVCRGQEEGAAVMGLGQSLFEAMCYDGTRLTNIAPIDYRVPLASDLPADFQSVTQEQGHGAGPFGSKGMGEGAMLPVASAIANAIEDALGVRITELPITPERVLAALDAKR